MADEVYDGAIGIDLGTLSLYFSMRNHQPEVDAAVDTPLTPKESSHPILHERKHNRLSQRYNGSNIII